MYQLQPDGLLMICGTFGAIQSSELPAVPGACMLSQNRVMRLLRRRSRIRTATVVATAQPQAQHGLYVIRLLWLLQAAMHQSRAPFPQAPSRRGGTHSDECESQSRTHD